MSPITPPLPRLAPPTTAIAAAAFVLLGSPLALNGTGSIFETARACDWRSLVQPRVSFVVTIGTTEDQQERRLDLRSPSDHLANIRQTLSPAIVDLATVFGVSRQAIYKWMGGESTPEPDKFARIRTLSRVADAFREAEVTHAAHILKIKEFDGASLMDLVAADALLPWHIEASIAEARAMNAAYERSGLAKTKAPPSEDWRTELSIPGSGER